MARKNSAIEKVQTHDAVNISDEALADLLRRLKTSVDPDEIRQLSDQIERVIFHQQFAEA